MITDIYSRKILGWEVHDRQSDELASYLAKRACLAEGISGEDIVLHSDNGFSMKGATMLCTLQQLGVIPSFSRPSVSNDNLYSEAWKDKSRKKMGGTDFFLDLSWNGATNFLG